MSRKVRTEESRGEKMTWEQKKFGGRDEIRVEEGGGGNNIGVEEGQKKAGRRDDLKVGEGGGEEMT